MLSHPPVPEHDTLVGFAPHFTSYGPRVARLQPPDHRYVEPPGYGEEPHFWGVYRWNLVNRWQWVGDCASEEIAYRLAVCWQEKMCHDR